VEVLVVDGRGFTELRGDGGEPHALGDRPPAIGGQRDQMGQGPSATASGQANAGRPNPVVRVAEAPFDERTGRRTGLAGQGLGGDPP